MIDVPGPTAPRLRVLLVEDDLAMLGALRDALGRAGFEVDGIQTAAEAVGLLAIRRYAAIVAECVLPDLSPVDWLAALRGVAPTTPLVLCCERFRVDEMRGLARDRGAVAVLETPVSSAQLVAAVREVVATMPPAAPRDR